MNIYSTRNHIMTFPYFDGEGCRKKVKIEPGNNEIDSEAWGMVRDQYKKHSQIYFRGITIKKGEKNDSDL